MRIALRRCDTLSVRASEWSLTPPFPIGALVFEVQTTMLSPQLLVDRGVAVSEVLQEAGEIVVTFPAAHFAVIDLGKKPHLACSSHQWLTPAEEHVPGPTAS